MAKLFDDVLDLCTHSADVYAARTVTSETGATSLDYVLATLGVAGKLFNGSGSVQQTPPGFRVIDGWRFITPLGTPVHERDRLLIDGAWYDVMFIRTVHDDEGASYLQIRLSRAAAVPFLTPGGI